MKYIRKNSEIEAITFEEFVEIGRKTKGASIVNGMPWSWDWQSHQNMNTLAVTHENDELYIIDGITNFGKSDMCIIDPNGLMQIVDKNQFLSEHIILKE